MLQKHPEVDESQQVIGWQPVYSTQQQQSKLEVRSQPNFLLGAGVGVAILSVVFSGVLLWGKLQKTEAQVQTEIQQAVYSERQRINECITSQKAKRPLFQTVRD
jgi:hypothetical protein